MGILCLREDLTRIHIQSDRQNDGSSAVYCHFYWIRTLNMFHL